MRTRRIAIAAALAVAGGLAVVFVFMREPERFVPPAADAAKPDEDLARDELEQGLRAVAVGHSTAALPVLQRAYDRTLSRVGDRSADLAPYLDALAAAKCARGNLREALRHHDRSVALRVAAFGERDPRVAIGLVARAKTRLEAGDIEGARRDIEAARSIDPANEVVAVEREIAGAVDGAIAPSATAATASATAATVPATATTPPTAAAADTAALRARYAPDLDPAVAADIAASLLGAGDRAGAADILGKTAASLGNEPSRTALRVFTLLTRASEAQAPAAARAAIALHQAMPALGRPGYDELWELSKR